MGADAGDAAVAARLGGARAGRGRGAGFAALLAIRTLQGVALAGVPAVGMAYLTEEIHPESLGSSIGLLIGGNAIGGMAGRLLGGALAERGDWRAALAGVAILSAICAAVFWRLAPQSRRHTRARFAPRTALAALGTLVRDKGQLRLDALAALLMGTFVAVYNGIGFRLEARPYGLGETAIAAIFLLYPIGSLSSALAGRLADRVGRRRVLPAGVVVALAGVGITAASSLPLIIAGIALLTIGFFAAHSVASSWVGRRAGANPAQASALYLLAYYAGSSLAGPLGGAAWSAGRWNEVVALAGALLAGALVVSLRLRVTPPRVAAGAPRSGRRAGAGERRIEGARPRFAGVRNERSDTPNVRYTHPSGTRRDRGAGGTSPSMRRCPPLDRRPCRARQPRVERREHAHARSATGSGRPGSWNGIRRQASRWRMCSAKPPPSSSDHAAR